MAASAALDVSLRELLARIGARLDVRRVERLDLETPASPEPVESEGPALAVIWLAHSWRGFTAPGSVFDSCERLSRSTGLAGSLGILATTIGGTSENLDPGDDGCCGNFCGHMP